MHTIWKTRVVRLAATFGFRAVALAFAFQAFGQGTQPADSAPIDSMPAERWNLFYQATSIGQYHGAFPSPYEGPLSLRSDTEYRVSLTTTLFLGLRLSHGTYLQFDPEIAGGRGFSDVNGMANASNGELPRVASAAPKPYVARLFIAHEFNLGGGTEYLASEADQIAGPRPMRRYTIAVGKFTVADFFDGNKYSHDPRSQFMGWAVMYNGAWDYPADVRGYTWGWMHEYHDRNWSVRYASAAMPKVANGPNLDTRIFHDRGDVLEGEYRWEGHEHPGAVRLLGYINHADAGTYSDAIRQAQLNGGTPDVTATRKVGTRKYGIGLNLEQAIAPDIGVFGRLGWNDGKTESFAFTAIDRLATGGISVSGGRWHRIYDTAAAELTINGISGVHASYLALGGLDFLIGDGRLNYAPERIAEMYYSARLFPGFFASFDLQHVNNPAYNRDRGPLWIPSLRFHIEVNVKSLLPLRSDGRFRGASSCAGKTHPSRPSGTWSQ